MSTALRHLVNHLAHVFGAARSSAGSAQAVLVCIDDELLGIRFGWGPEIEDFGEQLGRLAHERSLGSFEGVERCSTGHRLRFHTQQPELLLAALMPKLQESPMAAAISVRLGDGAGRWQILWP